MNYLDIILVEEIINTPTTVNSDYKSDSISISNREAECSVQVIYDGGVNVNMTIVVEVSNDNVNFAPIEASEQEIIDESGTHIVDILGTGTNYLRVGINVISGSIDIQQIIYKGKRRH